MRQMVMTAPGRIEFRQVDDPVAGAGEVLLRIRRIGVCGSDVHVYHGRHPYTDSPIVQGHEFAATVEAVGAGVTGVAVGAHVTALPQVVCGRLPLLKSPVRGACSVVATSYRPMTGSRADGETRIRGWIIK